MMAEKGQPTGVTIDEETKARLQRLAESNGVSVGEVVRRLTSEEAPRQSVLSPAVERILATRRELQERGVGGASPGLDLDKIVAQQLQIKLLKSLSADEKPPEKKSDDLDMDRLFNMAAKAQLIRGLPRMFGGGNDEESQKQVDALIKERMAEITKQISESSAGTLKLTEEIQNLKISAEEQKRQDQERKREEEAKARDEQWRQTVEALREEIAELKAAPKETTAAAQVVAMAKQMAEIKEAASALRGITGFGPDPNAAKSAGEKSDLDKARELINGISEIASNGVEMVSRIIPNRQIPGAGAVASGQPAGPNFPQLPPQNVEVTNVDPVLNAPVPEHLRGYTHFIIPETGERLTLAEWRRKYHSDPDLKSPEELVSNPAPEAPPAPPSREIPRAPPPKRVPEPEPAPEPEPEPAPEPAPPVEMEPQPVAEEPPAAEEPKEEA